MVPSLGAVKLVRLVERSNTSKHASGRGRALLIGLVWRCRVVCLRLLLSKGRTRFAETSSLMSRSSPGRRALCRRGRSVARSRPIAWCRSASDGAG